MQRIGEDGDAIGQQPAHDLQQRKAEVEKECELDVSGVAGVSVGMLMVHGAAPVVATGCLVHSRHARVHTVEK